MLQWCGMSLAADGATWDHPGKVAEHFLLGKKKNRILPGKINTLRVQVLVTVTLDGAPPRNGYFLGSSRFNFHFDAMPPNEMCTNLHSEGPDFIEPGDTVTLRIVILTTTQWRHLLFPGSTMTLNAASTVHFHGRLDEVLSVEELDV
jgi:hypothetical protein